MRLYTSNSSLLWIGVLFLAIVVMMVVGIGGFLLGTPLGLAILTFIVVRSLYRHFLVKPKNHYGSEQTYNSYQDYRTTDSPESNEEQEHTIIQDESERFNTLYRENDLNQHVFTSEDIRNAEDVEFKEVR